MSVQWVDFKEIKEKVTMEMVLSHYQLLGGLKQTPRGFRGPCPIHKGSHGNQFHVDPQKNRWNCFGGCDMDQLEGHVIGFVAAMEGVNLRDAALLLAEWYHIDTKRPSKKQNRQKNKNEKPPEKPQAPQTPPLEPPKEPEKPASPAQNEEPENQELTFQLKNLRTDHPFFLERSIAPETIKHFGLGFCSKGIMKDRIVFPIHSHDGKLIGYTGRTVLEVTDDNPKWKLPPNLIKPKVLLNFHQVVGKSRTVILVEGGFGLTAVHQAGFPNVVGLLGREILEEPIYSYDQLRLIVANFDQAVLLLDGDKDGREAADRGAAKLAKHIFVRTVTLPDNKDPGDFSTPDLQTFLSFLK